MPGSTPHAPPVTQPAVLQDIALSLREARRLEGQLGVNAPTISDAQDALQGLVGGLTRCDGLRRQRLVAICVVAARLADEEDKWLL